jgi:hypothetical protein
MPPRTSQNAAVRSTEGARGGTVSRRRGRPFGSKNKPKSLVPLDVADKLLLPLRDQLPPEHYEYIRGVVKDGKAVSTKKELQTLILLLSRNLWGALVDEMRPPQEPDNLDDALELVKEAGTTKPNQVFRRDVTERLKVLNSLLGLLYQVEKREEEKPDGREPLLTVYGARGLDRSRVAVLVGVQPSPSAGDVDGTGWSPDEARNVSGELPERPLELSSGEQE